MEMNRVMFLLVILILAFLASSIDYPEASTSTYTRSVLCEEGTATWCTPCVAAGDMLYSIYESGDYPFYYIAMVTDKQTDASSRLYDDYNMAGFPTFFFDGGYRVKFGSTSTDVSYREAIEACFERTGLPDLVVDMTVLGAGEGTFNITLEVKNNEDDVYHGYLRIYITEIVSRWDMKNGNPYHFAFLGYASDRDISVDARDLFVETVLWNGTHEGYADVRGDNVMVMAAVFNDEKHNGYANPPGGNSFDAYYVDYMVASKPQLDAPPSVDILSGPNGTTGFSRIGFEWRGQDDFTPVSDIVYSYRLEGNVYMGEWSAWMSTTRVTYENLSDGEYRFRVKAKDTKGQVSIVSAEREFRVDTGPALIEQNDPIDGEEDVPVYTRVSIFFAYGMNKTSVEKSLEIEPSVSYLPVWEENTLILKFMENLDYLTRYKVTVGKDAKRMSGQQLVVPYSFLFTTASEDRIPPAVVATDPIDGTKNVSTKSSVILFFSEPMDIVSVRRALRIDPWFSHQQMWRDNDTELILLPLILDDGGYTVTVLDTAMDKAGNNLTSDFGVYFEVSRPRILYTYPYDGEENVSISANLSIIFSEKMDVASLQEMITMVPLENFTVTQKGSTAMLDISRLSYDTEYTVLIGKDAAASDGSTLGSDYTWVFRTEKEDNEENTAPSFIVLMTLGGLCAAFIVMKKIKK